MASSILTQTAYTYIRTQIMNGQFMPGTLLSENELADTLNMSRTPIRAAITQLEHEGLLVTLKNRGLLVKEMSLKEAIDILDVIVIFQLYAITQMEERGETPDLKQLQQYLEQQFEAKQQDAYHQYVESALRFNLHFIAALNNNVVLQTMERNIEKLVLYSTINYKRTPHEPHYSANTINQSIYDGLLNKDYEGVRKIVHDSITHNRERMLRLGRI